MRKYISGLLTFMIVITILSVFSCASTQGTTVKPSQISYKEITADKYYASPISDLYAQSQGYKVTDVYIIGAESERSETGNEEALILFRGNPYSNEQRVYATNWILYMKQKDSLFASRMDAVSQDEKYNGHYTIYLYAKKTGNFFSCYKTKVIVYNVEGIPSQAEIDAYKAEQARIKAEKEAAAEKAKIEKKCPFGCKREKYCQRIYLSRCC